MVASRPGLSITKAGSDDIEELFKLMERANQYALAKAGENQWVAISFVREQFQAQIEQRECYVARNDQKKIIAAITLSSEDEYMWGDEGRDGQALYMHKLMKDPDIAPVGIGKQFMAFTAQEAVRRNKKYIRCDTKPTMIKLVNYYLRYGFVQKHTTIYKSTGNPAILLEADPDKVQQLVASDKMIK